MVDRIVVRPDIGARLAESLETALELADGIAVVEFADAPETPSPRLRREAESGDQRPGEGPADRAPRAPHPSPLPASGERGRPQRLTFSQRFACPVSGFTIPEIEPRLFSFNNPFGACPTCGGIGHEMRVDPASSSRTRA